MNVCNVCLMESIRNKSLSLIDSDNDNNEKEILLIQSNIF